MKKTGSIKKQVENNVKGENNPQQMIFKMSTKTFANFERDENF